MYVIVAGENLCSKKNPSFGTNLIDLNMGEGTKTKQLTCSFHITIILTYRGILKHFNVLSVQVFFNPLTDPQS